MIFFFYEFNVRLLHPLELKKKLEYLYHVTFVFVIYFGRVLSLGLVLIISSTQNFFVMPSSQCAMLLKFRHTSANLINTRLLFLYFYHVTSILRFST